jgi:hypothetical protein
MKINSLIHPTASTTSVVQLVSTFTTIAARSTLLLSIALASVSTLVGAPLRTGDIVYADSGNGIDGGFILKVDPATADQSVISVGGLLQMPYDVVVTAEGSIITSDSGRLIQIDPVQNTQTILASSSTGPLLYPIGLGLDRSGGILVASGQSIVRMDPASRQVRVLSSGGYLVFPMDVAQAQNGDLYVVNRGPTSQIIRVNPKNGRQTVVSEGGYLTAPSCIAVEGNEIFVTDTVDSNFGVGRVIHVDARTGIQSIVSDGNNLICPIGIAFDASGDLIVGDAYTINPNSADLYDGAILCIDPLSGEQLLLARGQPGFLNPRGVAVVPGSKSR